MSYAWEAYLNATKIDRERIKHGVPSEENILRERLHAVKVERDRLKAQMRMAKAPVGFTFTRCKCGFSIITLPTGKHYCPKCGRA